jgi:hypothetical protein
MRAAADCLALTALCCLLVVCGCSDTADIYVGRTLSQSASRSDAGGSSTPPAGPSAGSDEPAADVVDAGDPGAGAAEPPPPPVVSDAGQADDAGGEPPAPVCGPAFADCDGDPANGCETDIRRDPTHCGSCDVACGFPDCACEDGVPVLRCPPGRDDCDGEQENGCEVDLGSDPDHCGACDRRCHADGGNASGAQCTGGACVLDCTLTWGDCDGDPDNGCETTLWYNDEHCGQCGRECECHDNFCL